MIVHHDWESLKSRRSVSHLLSKQGGGIWAGGCALLRRLVCFVREGKPFKCKKNTTTVVLRSSVRRCYAAELGFVVPLVTRHFICVLEPEVLFFDSISLLCSWMNVLFMKSPFLHWCHSDPFRQYLPLSDVLVLSSFFLFFLLPHQSMPSF